MAASVTEALIPLYGIRASTGVQFIDFDREATSFDDAVLSAVADVEQHPASGSSAWPAQGSLPSPYAPGAEACGRSWPVAARAAFRRLLRTPEPGRKTPDVRPRNVVVWQPNDSEEQMSRRNQPDEDTVTVHVTPRGGLYVDPVELLRSKAAREMMVKMDRVLRADGAAHQGGAETSASSPQSPSRER